MNKNANLDFGGVPEKFEVANIKILIQDIKTGRLSHPLNRSTELENCTHALELTHKIPVTGIRRSDREPYS